MKDNINELIVQAEHEIKYNWLKAINTLKAIISLAPDISKPVLMLTEIYIEKKSYDKALKVLNSYNKNNPDDIDILFSIGRIFILLNMFTEAINIYEKIDVFIPEAYYNLALLYIKTNQMEKAIKKLTKLINYNPSEPSFYPILIQLLFYNKEYKKTIKYITTFEKIKNKKNIYPILTNEYNPEKILMYKGLCYLKNDSKNSNINFLEAYRILSSIYNDSNKKDELYMRALATSAYKIGLHEKAIEYLTYSIINNNRISNELLQTYIDLINIHIKNNNKTKAKEIIKMSKNKFPESYRISMLENKLKK